MPIPLVLQPPPSFEKSLVSAFQTNFNRIRDAFGRALGGDYQTGFFTVNFVAQVELFGTVTFPNAFSQTTGPNVILTPMLGVGAAFNARCWAVRCDNTGFVYDVYMNQGAAVTVNFQVKWLAFYS